MNTHRSNEDSLASLFDSWAHRYAEKYGDGSPIAHFFMTRLKRVCELLDLQEGSRVLDVGCGPGMMAEPLISRGIEFVGIDLSKEMVQTCQARIGHVDTAHFAVARIQQLPFPEGSFDAVLCMGVLEYVENHSLAVGELVRVLKPDGIVIFSFLNQMSPYRIVWRLRRSLGLETFPDTLFTQRYCRSLLRANRLEIVDLLYFDFNLFLPPLDGHYPRRSVRTSERLEFLARSSLRWLGTAFLVKARRAM